jgi:hypothetical protein
VLFFACVEEVALMETVQVDDAQSKSSLFGAGHDRLGRGCRWALHFASGVCCLPASTPWAYVTEPVAPISQPKHAKVCTGMFSIRQYTCGAPNPIFSLTTPA